MKKWGFLVFPILAWRWAAWLQVPYLLWVAFAGYLNGAVWLLNR